MKPGVGFRVSHRKSVCVNWGSIVVSALIVRALLYRVISRPLIFVDVLKGFLH